ncbi:Eco57I restriction-modification methylase domain-containing protein [Candidatus Contendibacter odensensis]|uniref:site-specific DNA-methyltransferase (adenine-specific) n=1 Tax=Candidatus Contendobacter odensis Run_B_J11 TaxID=1400861 RepID=A0A7U7GB09_9GAMM|nr:hypothetical protein [Candidatus Contendobacter odensis]CDH44782.1 conserved hypothetical protein [Candidatus Contendobacter odensis Run_B_J11]
MALNLRDCTFFGPALPETFVKYQLEERLRRAEMLPALTGEAGRTLTAQWEVYRRKLRALGEQGGERRVFSHVIEPLLTVLGYADGQRAEPVVTREGEEEGGYRLRAADDQAALRVWTVEAGIDLDAPNRRGRVFRFSPSQVAWRVLLTQRERVGLLTDGEELRLLLSDPAGRDSYLLIRLDRAGGWRAARTVPDSFRLLRALASPSGIALLPELIEQARLAQTTVTRKLRQLARALWHEGLVLICRLLFILKCEASPDPARAFSFASTSLWRNTYSPSTALAGCCRRVLDQGADSGRFLEDGLRALFRLFSVGLESTELTITRLGGVLFGEQSTPLLDQCQWGERAVAHLLDCLLWTPADGRAERERVHYGTLDVEDLGRVYEALLELEPGIAAEPMCRLRRAKLEVVAPLAQGERYRPVAPTPDVDAEEDADAEDGDEEAETGRGKKTAVQWIEAIPSGRFFLRVGLGRKASGSYYTPHPFVRFLVQEMLDPLIAARSPAEDPQPVALLSIKVLDPAMGSGHFLVEACRYLGQALYAACQACDHRMAEAEAAAEACADPVQQATLRQAAAAWQARLTALPDPDQEVMAYLPSRVPEGQSAGPAQRKAEALCRRLVAVHCLYGVDKNPLAVELAKLALWLESYAEGLPLTFLDHRLLCGDSLTGPFADHLLTYPVDGEPLADLLQTELAGALKAGLTAALAQVQDLEATLGREYGEIQQKQAAKRRLDAALQPFKTLAAAWSGTAMRGAGEHNLAWLELLKTVVVGGGDEAEVRAAYPALEELSALGRESVAYDLTFPEVFYPDGTLERTGGFDVVLGNPPWDAVQPLAKEFFAAFDLRILDAPTRRERAAIEKTLLQNTLIKDRYTKYLDQFDSLKRLFENCYSRVNRQASGQPSGAVMNLWQVFAERGMELLRMNGRIGWILPSAFHANQSATGIRELYLRENKVECCYSFENRRKLFNIHSSFKFATVVAQRSLQGTQEFQCAFYLHNLEWLFNEKLPLIYTKDFIRITGGSYWSFPELRQTIDVELLKLFYNNTTLIADLFIKNNIMLGRECHMTDDAHRFIQIDTVFFNGEDSRNIDIADTIRLQGYLTLHEGKTFHQYTDHWEDRPRYLVSLKKIADKLDWIKAASYYRLAFRAIASSTNERTAIFALLPGGVIFGNSAPCERQPDQRPNVKALLVMALANTFGFDWALRQRTSANVNLFILNGCPVPPISETAAHFLAHSALRLACNHTGYAPLWQEQLGDTWWESTFPPTWPVLATDDERWIVRAAMDAVVAQAYGLNREQYQHILASFSHRSYPAAPARCLNAFDELQQNGLTAFTRQRDPYWDIPLNEALPQPVINLPLPTDEEAPTEGPFFDRKGQGALLQPDFGPLFENAARPEEPPAPRRPRAVAWDDETYQLITLLLDEREVIASADAQELTGLDAAAVRPYLQRLIDDGKAILEGQRRGAKYRRSR